jgi:uncharacterized YigZ family protein
VQDYLSVFGYGRSELIIEKSRFIGHIQYVENIDKAFEFIKDISKKHSDATHNCYAFISDALGSEARFSDDGEPGGTAGMPILDVLKQKRLYKTAIAVTRYFGGIKLGAGGLVRAYSTAASLAADNAVIKNNIFSCVYATTLDYAFFKKFESGLKNFSELTIIDRAFNDGVSLLIAVPEREAPAFFFFF